MFRTTLIVIFTICGLSLNAQEVGDLMVQNKHDNLIVKNWTVTDGLISNSIRNIGKTHNGRLFITT